MANKSELVTKINELTGMTKKDSEVALKGVLESIEYFLEKGEKVALVGFGTWDVKETSARMGRNPRTKEEIEIPASKKPTFKFGGEFKKKFK